MKLVFVIETIVETISREKKTYFQEKEFYGCLHSLQLNQRGESIEHRIP